MATVAEVLSELLALPPAPVESYVNRGFHSLCRLLGCDEGSVVLGVRSAPPDGDVVRGFRHTHVWLFGHTLTKKNPVFDEIEKQPAKVWIDPEIALLYADGKDGTHRFHRHSGPRVEGTIDGRVWDTLRLSDKLRVIFALDSDRELHLGFMRTDGSRFDDVACDDVIGCVRAAEQWVRRVFFLVGLLPGHTPLSPRETEMLVHLLGPEQQKTHGDTMGLSVARSRELVRGIHHKLKTTHRADLQRTWMTNLDQPPCTGPTRIMPVRRRQKAEPIPKKNTMG